MIQKSESLITRTLALYFWRYVMKSFLKTVVGGTIGILALYVVGKVAFEAGHEMGVIESRYDELQRATNEAEEKKQNNTAAISEVPTRKAERVGGFFKARKTSVLGYLFSHPEQHKIEAYLEDDEVHVNVRRRVA